MSAATEETIREDVCDIIGRELSDASWAEAYATAKQKLRHIVDRYGDAHGARNTPEYMAELVIEAIRAEAMRQTYRGKFEGPAQRPAPQGHTNIIPQPA